MKKKLLIGLALTTIISGTVVAMKPDNIEIEQEKPKIEVKSEHKEPEPIPEEATVTAVAPSPIPKHTPAVIAPVPAPEPSQDTNPYSEGTQMHYTYMKRQQAGKAVGRWGSPTTWATAAAGAGVAVNSTPAIGATATDGNYLYTVKSFTDTTFIGESFYGGVVERELPISRFKFIH